MAGVEPTDGTSIIDLASNESTDAQEHVDASTYTLAAVFGPIALPQNMPGQLKAAIMDRAEQARDAAGDFLTENRMNPDDARARRAKVNDDDSDNLSQWAQIVQQDAQRREQEREEWSRTKSTVAGVTMTGVEWADLAKRLRSDDELHRRLMELFEARGMTKVEAETRYNRVADVAEIAAIPESQRTEAQAAAFEKAQADPTFRQDIRDADHAAKIDAAPKVASGLKDHFAKSAESDRSNEPTSGPTLTPERQVVAMTGPGF